MFPDWLKVTFNGMKTIDRVEVYSLQDNVTAPADPTDAMTFSAYGLVDFTVEGWNGSAWVVLGTVSGNNLVKRTVTFAPFTTDRIRVNVSYGLGAASHITEVEAWGKPAAVGSNVALSSAGAVATASSSYSSGFAPSAAINGDRVGLNWGAGSGWNDGTSGIFPDWLQVDFAGIKTIDRVVLFSLQDNVVAPAEPTDAMTFSSYGVVDFNVEGWNGSAWVVLATVSGNNLVKRTVTFPAFSTERIRVNITYGLGAASHVTELEAWSAGQ